MSTSIAESLAAAEIVRYYHCQLCDGRGALVKRVNGRPTAVLCHDCHGEGQLGATQEDVDNAESIGSDNPFCRHEWAGGDEEYSRCYCMCCGADGDA
jgi:DnaJ-class molecular chaperone